MEGVQEARAGSRPVLRNSWDIDCWDTEVGRRKESNGPGFPPDVWRAHMIDGICLLLY